MPKHQDYIKKIGRVLYVDPNEAFGSINGVPMTPDYSDFCISFKLECRIVPRFKHNVPIAETNVTVQNKNTHQDETVKYTLNWNTPYGTIGENQWVSFMQGDLYNNSKNSSLTTYYTDINYDDYQKETIVEGLGVESVTIAYENYYTPTITIKFVDHRGSALFGREEVTHYDNKITIDSIFGAFFTAPYPLFRMQVKGFYGKAVTYQMTCTSFKGRMNTNTGNFEATATFVGYSYSMLTDIPFEYLVAAPYCKYVGEDYWNAKIEKEEWRMEGSTSIDKTPTLFELFQRISAAATNPNLLQVISEAEKFTASSANEEINALYSLSSIYDTLFDEVKHRFLGDGSDDKLSPYMLHTNVAGENEQYLYMVNDVGYQNWNGLNTYWDTLLKVKDSFNEGFENDKIPVEFMPAMPPFDTLISNKLFNIDKEKRKISLVGVKEETVEELKKLTLNGVHLNTPLCEAILRFIKNPNSLNFARTNVYVIDWGRLKEYLTERISSLKTEVTEINRLTERNYLHLALENLGIIPYVGNIFKLVICHIETLVHMMHQCYINITNAEMVGQRTASYLNISKDFTDIVSTGNNIPPWPSITKSNDTSNYYLMLERENTFGWIGDFSDNFEEAKLVRALYLACERTSGDPSKLNPDKPVEFLYAPILPNDVNNNLNPFIDGGETISALGGMLGIRLAQIFGISEYNKVDDELSKVLGEIDALNYYRFLGDRNKLEEILTQGGDGLADVLYDIMLCKPSADKYALVENDITRHDFEFVTDLFEDIKRHPLFVEKDGELLVYAYMPTKSHYGIVPANARDIETYAKYLVGTRETGHYFEFDYLMNETFLHYCCADQLFEDYKTPDDKVKYINHELYKIVTDTPTIQGILKRYEQLKGNKINVMGEEYEIDLTDVLTHYWAVEQDSYYGYFSNANGYFSKHYKDIGVEDKHLLGNNFDNTSNVLDTWSKLRKLKLATFNDTALKFEDDSTEYKTDDLIIPYVDCVVANKWYSLFGVDFYYIQNQIENADTKNRVKALLFLHSLFYNKERPLAWDSMSLRHGMINRIPFGLAALYGAFLWRHNYIKEHGEDPIRYGDKDYSFYKPAYIKDGVEYTLYGINSNGHWQLRPKMVIEQGYDYEYKVFANNNETNALFMHMPDYFVANELLNKFDLFLNGQWQTICKLELRKSDGSEFFGGRAFNNYIEALITKRNETVTGKEDGTTESNLAWADSLNNATKQFARFSDNYSFIMYFAKDKLRNKVDLWLNTNNTEMQNALRSVYMGDCIELVTCSLSPYLKNNSTVNTYGDITLYSDNVKSYLNGFAEQLKSIKEKVNNDDALTDQDKQVIQDTPEFNRDAALPIYMYLKALWDKWLVAIDLTNHEFMAKNFSNNFIFMDSFYRNIAYRFMMNCQLILDSYNEVGTTTDTTAFKFLADVVNKHQLMFVGLPCFEYGMVSNSPNDQKRALETLETIFQPIPYEKMNPIDESNKFAVIYIPGLSEIPSELNGRKNDGFDIIDAEGKELNRSSNFPDILKDDYCLDEQSYGLYMGYGYYVPSFGLAYGRQNNHIFKNIKLSMETPIITSTVINTLSHTARIGANNTHRVAFIGQDIYPVFSNYSYICEFEMMGCAQIQPLMYFQLMNVPMWRGTYIIFSVIHTMTPGNMVTRVRAMKLSCRVVPYSNAWFTKNPYFDENEWRKLYCLDEISRGNYRPLLSESGDNFTPSDYTGSYGGAGIFSGKSMKEQLALCEVTTGTSGQTVKPLIVTVEYKCGVGGSKTCKCQLNKHAAEDFKAIAEEVAQLGWFNFNVTSSWRPGNKAYGHRLGIAVDINGGRGGNPWFNAHLCVNGSEPAEGSKLNFSMRKYSQPKNGYDKTKCIWHFNHPVAQIFRKHGWNWGGQFGDVMHFDLRGQECASGRNTESKSNGGPCPSTWRC